MIHLDLTDAELKTICKALMFQSEDHRWRAYCMEENAERFESEKCKREFMDMAEWDNARADEMMELRSKLEQLEQAERPKGTTEQNILAEIKKSGMTVRAVAKETGISEKALYAAFEGRSELRLVYFLELCQFLNLDPWEMAGQASA